MSRRFAGLLLCLACVRTCAAVTIEIRPTVAGQEEPLEKAANALQPGDELVLHNGIYSQTGRRAVTAQGTAEAPIVIHAADGAQPILTRPAADRNRHNNVEFVDCCHLVVRGLRFIGGSSGVRFIRGHHITFENCEIAHTGNNALTMNSGDCDSFLIRNNHIHHTGLSDAHPTEGEGMYIGCHDGSCVTTNSLIEGNHIHHLRGTSIGGSDGIEIKFGSYANVVRGNRIHDTNLARHYPGIFVYGGGRGLNIVEGNMIHNAGEGIQVVSDAVVRNNVVFDCTVTGITAAPHAAVPYMRNVRIVNNTIVNHPIGARLRWGDAQEMIFSNNAVYCPGLAAIDASGLDAQIVSTNYVSGQLLGADSDGKRFLEGGPLSEAFLCPDRRDYGPNAGSILIGGADAQFITPLDFTGTAREPPFDVGAYERPDTGTKGRK